jgi:hypothetical protein
MRAPSAHAPAAAAPARAAQQAQASALVHVVRDATACFQAVAVAEHAGAGRPCGGVSGADSGALGRHVVPRPLVMDGALDATRPAIVMDAPQPDGSLHLIGADDLVRAEAWHAPHARPPARMGQRLHRFAASNCFGVPAGDTLPVWAWKPSPTGLFVHWHANVSCDAFSGQTP